MKDVSCSVTLSRLVKYEKTMSSAVPFLVKFLELSSVTNLSKLGNHSPIFKRAYNYSNFEVACL